MNATITTGGKTGPPSEFTARQLFQVIQEPGHPEGRMYVMKEIAAKPPDEVAEGALAVLPTTDYLPGIAGIGGVLRKVFGNQVDFLDAQGWIRYLSSRPRLQP